MEAEEGAAGIILNRPTDLTVAATLPAWTEAVMTPAVIHFGGPVAVEHALVLAVGAFPEMVASEVGLADVADPGSALPASARVFAGYSGWSEGQLATEVAEGSWFVVDSRTEDMLDPEPGTLWRRVLRRQPDRLRKFASYPDDPGLN